MKNTFITILLMTLMLLAGCSNEPRIDATSEEAFSKSLAKVIEHEKDVQVKMQITGIVTLLAVQNSFSDTGKPYYLELSGMTGKEIIAYSDKLDKQRELNAQREREERKSSVIKKLNENIAEIEHLEQQNKIARSELANIKISEAKFEIKNDGFLEKPIISFSIDNTTGKTISRASFYAVLTSKDRKVAWIKDSFSYNFKGGLNPHEKQDLALAPNMFSDWGKLENRDDYTLEITLTKVFDENERVIWEIRNDLESQKAEYERKLQETLSENELP